MCRFRPDSGGTGYWFAAMLTVAKDAPRHVPVDARFYGDHVRRTRCVLSMNASVTPVTKSNPIAYFETQFGMLLKRLNVMRVHFSSEHAAILARSVVAGEDGVCPRRMRSGSSLSSRVLTVTRMARTLESAFPNKTAVTRTERARHVCRYGFVLPANKGPSTQLADFRGWTIAREPPRVSITTKRDPFGGTTAFDRTIAGDLPSRVGYLKRLPT